MHDDEFDFQEEKPLDFSEHSLVRSCPYCGETLASEELNSYLNSEDNTFTCPNCRKKFNVDELSTGI
ncbi:hypothetical protein ACFL1I_05020 [Candidatus Omnitrophota bacterium]